MKNIRILMSFCLSICLTAPIYGQVIETIAGGGERAYVPVQDRFYHEGIVSPNGDFYFLFEGIYHKLDPLTEVVEEIPFPLTFIRTLDLEDNFYTVENYQIIKTDGKTGERTVIAGNGLMGASPDGTIATEGSLGTVGAVRVIKGRIFFVENGLTIRYVDPATSQIQSFLSAASKTCNGNPVYIFDTISDLEYDPVNNKVYFSNWLGIYGSNLDDPVCISGYGGNTTLIITGIAVTSDGNLVYTDYEDSPYAQRLNVETGEFTFGFGDHIDNLNLSSCGTGGMDGPTAVYADYNGNLFITYRAEKKLVYSSGNLLKVFESDVDNSGNNGPAVEAVLSPAKITIDPEDNLYVYDPEAEAVRKVNGDGSIVKFIGRSQNGDTPYNHCIADITDIEVNASKGSLHVALHDPSIYADSYFREYGLGNVEMYPVSGPDVYSSGAFRLAAMDDGRLLGLVYGNLQFIQEDGIQPVNGSQLENYYFDAMTPGSNGWVFLTGYISNYHIDKYFFKYNIFTGDFEILDRNELQFEDDSGNTGSQNLTDISSISYDGDDGIYFVSMNRIFRLDFSSKSVRKIAGTGIEGFSGDGGDPVNAQFSSINDLAVDSKGNLYISDSGNDRIRKISGLRETSRLPEIGKFVLVNPRTDQEIRELEALDYWFLPDLWRINVIAEPVDPALVQSVTYRVDGKYDHTENAYPYALGGDDAGDYREWSAGNGVYNICATPYSLPHRQGTEGEEKCITLSLIFTLPAMMEGSGEIYSARGSYVTMPDAEGATFYDFTAYYDHATEEFSGWASVEFPDAGLMFTSSTPHHFFQRTTRAHLFWDGMLNGEEGYRMDQYLGYRPARTDTRIIVRHISTGEIIYDSEVTIAAAETNQLSAPLWTELNGSGDAVLEASIDAVHVGPNPFSDRIALALPMNDTGNAARVTLTDLQGRVIYDGTAMPGAVSQIETSGLNSGLYILSLKNGELDRSFRLVKP